MQTSCLSEEQRSDYFNGTPNGSTQNVLGRLSSSRFENQTSQKRPFLKTINLRSEIKNLYESIRWRKSKTFEKGRTDCKLYLDCLLHNISGDGNGEMVIQFNE